MRLVLAFCLMSALIPTAARAGELPPSMRVLNLFTPHLGLGWQGERNEGRVLLGLDIPALAEGKPRLRLGAGDWAPLPAPPTEPGGGNPVPVVSLTFTLRF